MLRDQRLCLLVAALIGCGGVAEVHDRCTTLCLGHSALGFHHLLLSRGMVSESGLAPASPTVPLTCERWGVMILAGRPVRLAASTMGFPVSMNGSVAESGSGLGEPTNPIHDGPSIDVVHVVTGAERGLHHSMALNAEIR